jgi:thiol-disulfide isomerase/thioredoxin
MKKMRFVLILICLLFCASHSSVAPAGQNLTLLYFFSPTCSHCKAVAPLVKELNKEFPAQGVIYGKGTSETMPFEVRRGDKQLSKQYGVQGVPSLVVLIGGKVKTVFRGEFEIKASEVMIRAFRKGALTVSEAAADGPRNGIMITGWLLNKGDYFKDSAFVITDRREDIRVKPWLPLEIAKSPFRKRTCLMSDVINKAVVLRGDLVEKRQGLELIVAEEVLVDVN